MSAEQTQTTDRSQPNRDAPTAMTAEQLRALTAQVLPVLHGPDGPVAGAVKDIERGALELCRTNARAAEAVKKLTEQLGSQVHLTTHGVDSAAKAIAAAAHAQSVVGNQPASSPLAQPWFRQTELRTPTRPWSPIDDLTGRPAGGVSAAFSAITAAATTSSLAAAAGVLTSRGIAPVFAGSATLVKLADELTKQVRPPFTGLTGAAAALRAAAATAADDSRRDLTGMLVGESLSTWMKNRMPTTPLLTRSDIGRDSIIGKLTAIPMAAPWIHSVAPAGPAGYLASISATVRESQAAMRHMMHAWMPTESIADKLKTFGPLAERGFAAAFIGLRAAMNVVAALRRKDVRGFELVRDFMVDWLSFTRDKLSWDLVNSAVMVLLDTSSWLPREPFGWSYDPIDRLRQLTLRENRSTTRLLTDPTKRLGGQPLVSLHEPVAELADGTILTHVDVQPDHQVPGPEDAFVEITDPRLEAIWGMFTAREREVIYMRGHARMTWADAAVMCGATVAEGELLRRRVKRIAAK